MADRISLSESSTSLSHHGGNLDAARRIFPGAPEPWIDLSTGINADPYPFERIETRAWTQLPEPRAIAQLEASAAACYGARDRTHVVAAPGTQALIQWLPQILTHLSVGVFGFTYGEHTRIWKKAGRDISIVNNLFELANRDIAIVVNPNNPDGRLVSPSDLHELALALARKNGVLIVDEAFMDLVKPTQSLIPNMPKTGTIILRSFGKTYGLAGLRLGFGVISPDLAPSFREALGPWAVSGPAIEVGCHALTDHAWLEATILRLQVSTAGLDKLLTNTGFTIAGGTLLYRLAVHQAAAGWFARLGQAGILVRPFAAKPDWLRFGIPHHEHHWARLKQVLDSEPAIDRRQNGRTA
jgi:cobalamin biosynthesis protein CobC